MRRLILACFLSLPLFAADIPPLRGLRRTDLLQVKPGGMEKLAWPCHSVLDAVVVGWPCACLR